MHLCWNIINSFKFDLNCVYICGQGPGIRSAQDAISGAQVDKHGWDQVQPHHQSKVRQELRL